MSAGRSTSSSFRTHAAVLCVAAGCAHPSPAVFSGSMAELARDTARRSDLAVLASAVTLCRAELRRLDEQTLPMTMAALEARNQSLLGVCLAAATAPGVARAPHCLDASVNLLSSEGDPLPFAQVPPPGHTPANAAIASAWAVGMGTLALPFYWLVTGTAPSAPSDTPPSDDLLAAWEALKTEQRDAGVGVTSAEGEQCSLFGLPGSARASTASVWLYLGFPASRTTCKVLLSVQTGSLGSAPRRLTFDDAQRVECFEL